MTDEFDFGTLARPVGGTGPWRAAAGRGWPARERGKSLQKALPDAILQGLTA